MSRFLCCADLHLRGTSPVFRKDNYPETIFRKLQWIVNKANTMDATLLIAGDIMDSVKVGTAIINRTIKILQGATHTPVVVLGQHDMLHHRQDLMPSPIYTLILAQAVKLATPNDSDVCGCSWEQEPSKVAPVLLIHRTITPAEVPFFLKDGISAADAMDVYQDFEFIVSGDYHGEHISSNDHGQLLINCGTIGRSSIDQEHHQPRVHLLETETGNVLSMDIPCEPFEDVFDLRLIEMSNKTNFKDALVSLSAALQTNSNSTFKFKDLSRHLGKVQNLTPEETVLLEQIIRSNHA